MKGAAARNARQPPEVRTPSGDRPDVGALRALLALRHLVLDLLVLLETLVAITGDAAEMHEDVGATVVLGDESEALLGVEPLHGSCAHERSLLPCPGTSLTAARRAIGPWTER